MFVCWPAVFVGFCLLFYQARKQTILHCSAVFIAFFTLSENCFSDARQRGTDTNNLSRNRKGNRGIV